MHRLVSLFSAAALLIGCAIQRKNARDIEKEKAEVEATLVKFWRAYEQKDLASMSGILTASSNFIFFGSDAAEVIGSRREWESLMQNDWQLFQSTKFGESRNLAIQVSDDGKLASAVYEVSDISIVDDREIESLDRFAITMRKEKSGWRIVQGMTAVATVGKSSAEMVARRKTNAPKN